MHRLLGLTAAAVFVGLVLTARPAVAAGDEAERLTVKALDLRKIGDDQGALPLLERAHELSRSPRSAAQLGLCEQALGRWADAETNLTEGLKGEGDPWIKKNRRALEDALVTIKSHIARVEIGGEPQGAEVSVNGNVVGRLPLAAPVRANAGQIEIEVRAPGYLPASRNLRIDGGQYQKVVLRLEREPPPAATAAAPAVAAAERPASEPEPATAGGPPAVETSRPPPASGASDARKAVKWVVLGGAVLGLGAGIYGTAQNGSLVTDFDGGCGIIGGKAMAAPGSPKTDGQCADLKNRYELAARIGIAGFVATGALGATALILWLTEPSARDLRTAASYACAAAPMAHAGLSVGCLLRF